MANKKSGPASRAAGKKSRGARSKASRSARKKAATATVTSSRPGTVAASGPPVAGIGTSAGDPEVLKELFATMPRPEIESLVHQVQVRQMELELQNAELREVQLELAASRDRYSNLYEFAPFGYLILDRDARIRQANLAAASMLGLERGQLLRHKLPRFIARGAQDAWQRYWRECLRPGEEKRIGELEMHDADGGPLFVRLESMCGYGLEGEVESVRTALLDRTSEHETREKLQHLNDTLEQRVEARTRELQREHGFVRKLIETARAIILVLDPQGRVALANACAAETLGRDVAEMRGANWFETFLPERERMRIHGLFKRAIGGESTRGNINAVLCKDGGERLVEWYDSVLTGDRGETTGLLCIGQDVTEREGAQAELRRGREQLRALTMRLIESQEQEGKRIARELHDAFGQKLTGLAFVTSQLEKDPNCGSGPMREQLAVMRADITELARQIHDMSRRLHPAALTDLGLVAALKAECRGFAERTGIPTGFCADLLEENVPEALALCLYRILQETLSNIARHAYAERVAVTLVADAEEISLRVEDTGDGFDLTAARGTGLGLVSMEERAAAEGGRLLLDSEPGRGTTVEVILPLERAPG